MIDIPSRNPCTFIFMLFVTMWWVNYKLRLDVWHVIESFFLFIYTLALHWAKIQAITHLIGNKSILVRKTWCKAWLEWFCLTVTTQIPSAGKSICIKAAEGLLARWSQHFSETSNNLTKRKFKRMTKCKNFKTLLTFFLVNQSRGCSSHWLHNGLF